MNCDGCNGLFFRVSYQDPQRLAMVRDGTSNTFMVGEDIPEHNYRSGAYYANSDFSSCHAPLNYFPDPPTPYDWFNIVSFRSRHPGRPTSRWRMAARGLWPRPSTMGRTASQHESRGRSGGLAVSRWVP